jgi:ATP-dependent exoDNAse (exonuclease V) alpha subunit
MQHYTMLKRNLVYTGLTRGKRLMVLVGQKRALTIAVKGKQLERRWSKLEERLRQPLAPVPNESPEGEDFSPGPARPA